MKSDGWFVLNRGKISTAQYTHQQLEKMRGEGACDSFTRISQDRSGWILLDDYLAQCRAEATKPAPIRPPALPGAAAPAPSTPGATPAQDLHRFRSTALLRPFPVFPLLLLHYQTLGIFSFFWITGMHGKLPPMKADDPSAAKAIGLCFIPFFNLYWIFKVFPRLAERVNAVSRQYMLPTVVPPPLAYTFCILILVPAAMATAGCLILMMLYFSSASSSAAFWIFLLLPNLLTLINYLVVMPILAGLVQRAVNDVADAQVAQLQSAAG